MSLRLLSACESDDNPLDIVDTWYQLVRRNPESRWLQARLAGAYDRLGSMDRAISGWRDLVIEFSDVSTLQERLIEACAWDIDRDAEIGSWMQILEKLPSNETIQFRLHNAFRQRGFRDPFIHGWKKLIYQHPNILSLKERLAEAYEICGLYEEAALTWKELLLTATEDDQTRAKWSHRLRLSLARRVDNEAKIAIWTELVHAYPSEMIFCRELESACLLSGNKNRAHEVWKQITNHLPGVRLFSNLVIGSDSGSRYDLIEKREVLGGRLGSEISYPVVAPKLQRSNAFRASAV